MKNFYDGFWESFCWVIMKDRKLVPRITVSLDKDSYRQLNRIADRHDVSLSWLTRYAINEFLQQCRSGAKIELAMMMQDEKQ